MSANAAEHAVHAVNEARPAEKHWRLPERKAVRSVLCLALATCLATVLPFAGTAMASAAPVTTAQHGGSPHFGGRGGGPGNGGNAYGHHRTVSVTGSVATAPASTTLSATSFTITPLHGTTTWTIDVSGSTTYSQPGVSSPGVGNVIVGDQVVVRGHESATGTIDASSVRIPAAVVTGIVYTAPTSAGGSIVLTGTRSTIPLLNDTSVTANLDVPPTTTTFRQPGVTSPIYSDVLDGEQVVLTALQTGTTTVDATSVRIPSVVVKGTVATTPAPATTGFTLTSTSSTIAVLNDTTVTVDVTGSTTYRERGVSSPSVQPGDQVSVTAEQSGTTTVEALSVVISSPPKPHHRGGYGNGGGGNGQGGGAGGWGSGNPGHHGRR